MNLGVLTNTGEGCGIAQYGADLIQELSHYYPVNQNGPDMGAYDALIVNWHPSRLNFDVEKIRCCQHEGCKVILLVHNSSEGMIVPGPDDMFAVADAVVMHEPVEFRGPIRKFRYIPIGIPEVAVFGLPYRAIGTAGFAFAHRHFDMVVDFACEFNAIANIICPPYPCHVDPNALEAKWRQRLNGNLHIAKEFLPVEQVVWRLAESMVNIFWFEPRIENDDLGQSASVRMGIAAQRPIVLNRSRKFRSLFAYEDEFYFCNNKEDARMAVKEIIDNPNPRIPKRVLQEQCWSQVALQWKSLVDEVAA